MKIQRAEKPGNVWPWLIAHLPTCFRAKESMIGYGVECAVYLSDHMPGFFGGRGDPIALVAGLTVELYHPEYYSDFSDLLLRFESESGYEPVLKYWASPKDPSHG